jgi:hypothetical protein
MTSSPANWFSSQIFHKIYEGILNLMRVWHLCTKVPSTLLFTGTFVRTKVLLDASKVRRYEGITL